MIRFFVGFLLVFGAVGGLDNGESLWACMTLAGAGFGLMLWGLPRVVIWGKHDM